MANGANINVTSHNGKTAVMMASIGGHVDVVEALIDAGKEIYGPLFLISNPEITSVQKNNSREVCKLMLS